MKNSGFSLVEVLIALGILGIILPLGIGLGMQSLNMSRKSSEKTEALFFAQEGIEASRGIASENWSSLSLGNYGLNSSGAWQLISGGNVRGKFNRVINISPLYRDGSGNLVESGGTLDNDALKINSNVSWSFGGMINDSVSVSSYLTNFRKVIWGYGDAYLAYSGPLSQVYSRYYDDVNISVTDVSGTGVANLPRVFVSASSPTNAEMIVAHVTSTGLLNVGCLANGILNNQWSVNIGGNNLSRRFDVAYETNSGNVLVVYSRNVGNNNELGYRTKLGSAGCGSANWSSEISINPIRTSGIIQWVKLSSDRRVSSNLVAMTWADVNRDLSAMIWNGSLWGNEPTTVSETNLDYVSNAGDIESFDLDYESLTGDLMLIWGQYARSNNTNGVRYRTCNNGTGLCNWSSILTPPSWRDDATTLDLGANPSSDEMSFGSIGMQQSDLQLGYWNGNSWVNDSNTDTSSSIPIVGSKQVAVTWLRSGTNSRSVVAYTDSVSTSLDWYVGNGGTFSLQTDFSPNPLFGATQSWLDFGEYSNLLDRNVLLAVDSANRMHLKRINWNGSVFSWNNVSSSDNMTGILGQRVVNPAVFSYWRSKN